MMRRKSHILAVCLLVGAVLAAGRLWIGPVGSARADDAAATERLGSARPTGRDGISASAGSCDPPFRGEDPHDIVLSPDGGRAYVVNRSTDNLFVIDLASNSVVQVIDLYSDAHHPLGPGPMRLDITPDGSRLLVTAVHESSIILVDAATGVVLARLPVGNMPADVAVSPDGSLALVPNKNDWTATLIDLTAPEVATTIALPGGGGPFAVAWGPDGSRAYVAMQDAPVYVIDPATHTIAGTIPVAEAGHAGDLVVSADGSRAYLAALHAAKVHILDLESNSAVGAITVEMPKGLALSADGSRLYVGTFGFSGESAYHVWMFDTESGEALAGVKLEHPGAPRLVGSDVAGLALSPDESGLYVPSIDGECVFVVDAATLEQLDIILTNPIPQFAPLRGALSPHGAYLYLASWTREPTTVSVIDTAASKVVAEIRANRSGPCTSTSWGLDVSPDGETVYVLASDNRCILIVDAVSRSITGSLQIPVSGSPSHLTHIAAHPNGDRVYVLEHAGTVHVIDAATHNVRTTIETADMCSVLKLSPDGQRGYVICSSALAILDLTTDTLLDTIRIGTGGSHFDSLFYVGVAPDSSWYVIGAFFNMYAFDAATNTQLRNLDLEQLDRTWLTLGQDVVFSTDGSLAYLAMPDENAVTVFDAETWEVTAKIDTGCAPHLGTEPVWLLMSPDGSLLYVVNELSDNVLVIDTTLNQVAGVISLRKCYACLPLLLRNP